MNLTYVDEDGDQISLASNEDMKTAYELNSEKHLLKVRITLSNTQEEASEMKIEEIHPTPVLQAVEEEVKEEPKKETQQEEVHEKKWHKWANKGKCGGKRQHHKHSSSSSAE